MKFSIFPLMLELLIGRGAVSAKKIQLIFTRGAVFSDQILTGEVTTRS